MRILTNVHSQTHTHEQTHIKTTHPFSSDIARILYDKTKIENMVLYICWEPSLHIWQRKRWVTGIIAYLLLKLYRFWNIKTYLSYFFVLVFFFFSKKRILEKWLAPYGILLSRAHPWGYITDTQVFIFGNICIVVTWSYHCRGYHHFFLFIFIFTATLYMHWFGDIWC